MKTQPKFSIGQAVTNGVNTGVIQEVDARFADHSEYLVAWPDQTAAWVHADKLQPAGKPAAAPAQNTN